MGSPWDSVRVSLLPMEIEFLRMISQRGGEMPFSWAETPTRLLDVPGSRFGQLSATDQLRAIDGVKAMFVVLINKGLLIEREYAADARSKGTLYIALTDGGRQVADQIFALDAARRDAPVVESQLQKDNQAS